MPAKLDTPPPENDVQALARSYNALGADLYKKLRSASAGKGNLAMSPASIGIALGMTWLGARGDTAQQMQKTMHLTLEPAALEKAHAGVLSEWLAPNTDDLVLRVANRLFVERTLKVEAPFLKATRDGFGAPVELMDFAKAPGPSRTRINDWVSQQTRERIRDLLPPDGVSNDTRVVLTNAMYFKAKWATPFEESATKPKPFYAEGTRKIGAPTMSQVGHYAYREVGDVEVAEIPYSGARFAMAIVLPKKRDGLGGVEDKLSAEVLQSWLGGKQEHKRLRLELPKFKVEPGATVRLKDALSELGMPVAFDRAKADFTGIHVFKRPEDRLLISNVFHKAFVEVNEKGTEAAAATAVSMAKAGAAPPSDEPKPFVADHPFLFVLRDVKSQMVLFIGRVTQPKG
jgi:serpin B